MSTKAVHKLLAPTGDQALLAAGSGVASLAIGQMGIFNYHTGLSVDGTVPADTKDIFLAVGVDPLGTGSLADIEKSAGQVIQVRNSRFLTFKGYLANVNEVIDVTGFAAQCQTDYALKVSLSNGLGFEVNGYTQVNKTFNFTTGCCPDQCAPCALGDTNELALGMINAINADEENFLTAVGINSKLLATVNTAPTADADTVVTIGGKYIYTVALLDADTVTLVADKIVAAINASDDPIFASNIAGAITVSGGAAGSTFTVLGAGITVNAVSTSKTVVAVVDIPAYVAANPGAGLGIRITASPLAAKSYGNINNGYTKLRNTNIGVYLLEGFTCNGVVTQVTNPVQAEGLGYDLAQTEYQEQGWGKLGPYRLSSVLGQERSGFTNYISRTGTYNQFVLGYDQMSVAGWNEHLNNLETIIAVPCADSTTLASIATMFDLIFTQFGGMAGDVAANGDCTNVATNLLTAATDGLESLA